MPTKSARAELTQLLVAWTGGDEKAFETLSRAVYDELRRLARNYMRGERPGHTLEATALVHEAFVRIIDWKNVEWKSRAHFFAVASQMMRRILVDHARARRNQKRGGEWKQMSLSAVEFLPENRRTDVLDIDAALEALKRVDARKAKVVELRFFGGLTVEETAAVLDVSSDTVLNDWRFAKAWLLRELERGKRENS
jgi:RNA polymerase sigma factor (TIGR02999 family)